MNRVETYSTADLVQAERLEYWNHVACSTIGPLAIDAADRDRFGASMKCVRLRNCEIVSPVSNAATIRSVAGGAAADVLNLQVQHCGRSTTQTGDRVCSLEPGDFTLYDPARAFRLDFSEATQVIVIRLPLADAEGRMPGLRHRAGVPMRADHGPRAILSNFVRNAWQQLDGDELGWADSLCDVIWPLVQMAYSAEFAARPAVSPRERRREDMFRFIEAHLCDPELTAHAIAAELGVSARYVQMIFAEIGTTPGAYVQSRRLDRAARELSRAGGQTAVTEVAFGSGFNDLSTFCRVFRRKFGIAPRDYRAGRRTQ
jgi:AraC-like DNA-binding protein